MHSPSPSNTHTHTPSLSLPLHIHPFHQHHLVSPQGLFAAQQPRIILFSLTPPIPSLFLPSLPHSALVAQKQAVLRSRLFLHGTRSCLCDSTEYRFVNPSTHHFSVSPPCRRHRHNHTVVLCEIVSAQLSTSNLFSLIRMALALDCVVRSAQTASVGEHGRIWHETAGHRQSRHGML